MQQQYKQVKIYTDPELADDFKKACAKKGVSMASVLSEFMRKYTRSTAAKKTALPDYSEKRQRRAAIKKIIEQLERIRSNEENYRDAIPPNLRYSTVYNAADDAVTILDEVLERLDLY